MRNFFTTFYLLLVVQAIVFAQGPPTIELEGLQTFCGESPMPIVTEVNIFNNSGASNELDNVRIQISEGYNQGQDLLSLTGIHPNISATWNEALGELLLEGTATYVAYEAAIVDVVFQTTQNNFTEDKFFSINLGEGNFLPSTGHYYYYVESQGIAWNSAKTEAESLDYFGLQGYLATITTIEEAELSGEQTSGTGWIGASDMTTEGIWTWETGPEIGQAFYNQNTGESINDSFSFWNIGEPNNSQGNEDYAHITDPSIGELGSWNDLPNEGSPDPNNPYHPQGYIVEFGGMSGDPLDIQISASTKIIMPKLTQLTDSVCESEGTTIVNIVTNTDYILWFESQTSETVLYSGSPYETIINETTTFWILQLFEGCTEGIRVPVTIEVDDAPEANNIQAIQCDDDGDGISVFNLNSYMSEITPEDINNVVIDFYFDVELAFQIDGNSYQNLFNQQIVYAKVESIDTGCFTTAQIELIVSEAQTITNTASLEACDSELEIGLTLFDLSLANAELLEGLPLDLILSYHLSYQDAVTDNNQLPIVFTNTIAYNQTLYARIEFESGCYGVSEVYLQVLPLPELTPDETIYYCLNNYPESITLNGGIEENISDYYYNWSTGETTSQIQINEVGVYNVVVTGIDNCANTKTITVLPSNIATIDTFEINDSGENNTIVVFVSGEGDYEYALNDSNGPYQSSNTFENVEAGFHTIYVRDILNNCGVVSDEVSVIGFPKFFTPNGDADNQNWKIKGISEQFYPNSKVLIFNRYGKLIKELNPLGVGWDGTLNGVLMPTSDYWFSVRLQDGRTFKGHFALKR